MQREFDPIELIREFNRKNIRYILIGRQAVVQYGANLFSFDYDFWVHPDDKKKTYQIIKSFGLTSKYLPDDRHPIDIFTDDEGNKVDVFFVKSMANRIRRIFIEFNDTFKNAVIKRDVEGDFFLRVPCIDDLIKLKKLGSLSAKDKEDIEYLRTIKRMRK